MPVKLSLFHKNARWIWHGGDRNAYHEYVRFRRTFTLAPAGQARSLRDGATLAITADAMYQVWLNGKPVGHGPAKSAEGARSVDSHDISQFLQPGENCLEVLVLSIGVGTMTYCPGDAGLIFQIALAGKVIVVSDRRTQVQRDPQRIRPTARRWILPCIEDVDAAAGNSKWASASVVRNQVRLYPRRVPMPTRRALLPQRLVGADIVQLPNFSYSLRLKPCLDPGASGRRSNIFNVPSYIITDIISPVAQMMEFVPTLGGVNWYFAGKVLCKGSGWTSWQKSQFDGIIQLRKGANRLVGIQNQNNHFEDINLCAFTEKPVRAINPFGAGAFQVILARQIPALDISVDPDAPTMTTASGTQAVNIDRLDWGSLVAAMPVMDPAHTMIGGNAQDLLANARELRSVQVEPSISPLILPASSPDQATRVILDLGVLENGWLAFDAIGHQGSSLIVSFLEGLEEGPPRRIQWTTGCNNALTYRLRNGHQSFQSFLPYGVRYLLVHHSGPQSLRLENLRILTANCGSVKQGSLRSSDRLLNGIYDICTQSVISSTDDTFTDCPTYEQVNWNYDNRMTFLADALTCNNAAVARNTIELFTEDPRRPGLVRSHYPSTWDDSTIPLWCFHWIMMCHDYYWHSGDTQFAARLFPQVAAGIREALTMLDERSLLQWQSQGRRVWHFVEWGPGRDDNHPVVSAEQAGLIGAIDAAVRLGRVVKHDSAELRQWSQARSRIIRAVHRWLWDARYDCYADSLHADGSLSPVHSQVSNAALAIYGAGTIQWRRRLCDRIIDNDRALISYGSPCGVYYILELFDAFGEVEAIFNTIRRQWGQMVLAGDTTTWEMFFDSESKRGGWPTRSRCHPFASYVVKYMIRYALGIKQLTPGYTRIDIAPRPPRGMSFCSGSVPTPSGMLRVKWEKKAGQTIVQATAPTDVMLRVDPEPKK